MNRRITVGLLIDDLLNDYSQAICQGASFAAEEVGIDLVTISVGEMFDQGSNPDWKNRHYNAMMHYPQSEVMDALVISVGTVFRGQPSEYVLEKLKSFEDIPVVSIAVEFDNCGCVRFDSQHGIEQIIEHLVDEHDCRNIAYISGPPGNMDSEDRLNAFLNALKKLDLPINSEHVTYGNFSEYSLPVIQRFMDKHLHEIDAICCANDTMAMITCQELARRGITAGKDIPVTGYDNMPWSGLIRPSLSTVAASAADLGYQAVFEAVRLTEGKPPRSVTTPTFPIIRESCGCCTDGSAALYDHLRFADMTEAVQAMINGREYIPTHDRANGILARSWILRLEHIIHTLVSIASDPEVREFPLGDLLPAFRQTVSSENLDLTASNTLHDLLFVLRDILLDVVSDEEKSPKVYDVILSLQRVLSNASGVTHYALLLEARRNAEIMDSIRAHDGADLNTIVEDILHQLCRMRIQSSWIYLLSEPLPVSTSLPPRKLNDLSLRGYHIGSECHTLGQAEGRIADNELLTNPFVPNDRRKNLVLVPLFTSREQYGLLLCEVEHEYYSHVNSVSRQLSSILETSYLLAQLNEQMDQMTLRYAALRNIASRDELTGCYNRRGFFEVSEHIARTDSNAGKRAIVAFADLDNLKLINDQYLHDQGDAAITLASQALQKCFGPNSIIGRIGGDEFAVFDLDTTGEPLERIHQRLKKAMETMDRESTLPYHVTISIGLTEFRCNNEVVLRGFVDRADRQQYIDKKQKPTKVSKD